MTFSIIAVDKVTGDFGGAVASRLLRVGALVIHLEPNIGALATMNCRTQPFRFKYGSEGLRLLANGSPVKDVLEKLLGADDKCEEMQISVIDKEGNVAAKTGKKMPSWSGQLIGDNFSVHGNSLAGEDVIRSMFRAFDETKDEVLAERLLRAMEAGDKAGGDRRGKQSAGLRVVREYGGPRSLSDRLVDLRVDDHPEPLVELRRLLELHNKGPF